MMQGGLALMVLRYALYTRLMSGHTRLKSVVDLRCGSSTFTGVQNHRKITGVNDILINYSSLYNLSRETIRYSWTLMFKNQEN